jgi:G3E family GTPase
VIQTFFADDDVRRKFRVDGIVTMVDARHVWNHLYAGREVREQIAFADVMIGQRPPA